MPRRTSHSTPLLCAVSRQHLPFFHAAPRSAPLRFAARHCTYVRSFARLLACSFTCSLIPSFTQAFIVFSYFTDSTPSLSNSVIPPFLQYSNQRASPAFVDTASDFNVTPEDLERSFRAEIAGVEHRLRVMETQRSVVNEPHEDLIAFPECHEDEVQVHCQGCLPFDSPDARGGTSRLLQNCDPHAMDVKALFLRDQDVSHWLLFASFTTLSAPRSCLNFNSGWRHVRNGFLRCCAVGSART